MLAALIDAAGALPDPRAGRPERSDHYGALVRAIVGQQLSVSAARANYARLTARFEGRPPTAEEILADDPELNQLCDDQMSEELVAVKGIGLWSAHMFHLERPDVLPVGDLGIRRAIERA